MYKTTIDQHQGTHEATGLPIYQLKDIITDYSDYSQERWDDLDADGRAWWTDLLREVHEAMVDLESLPDDERRAAKEYLEDSSNQHDDIEYYPVAIRAAIASVTTEI